MKGQKSKDFSFARWLSHKDIKDIFLKIIIQYNSPVKAGPDESRDFSFYEKQLKMPYVRQNKKELQYRKFTIVLSVWYTKTAVPNLGEGSNRWLSGRILRFYLKPRQRRKKLSKMLVLEWNVVF